MTNITKEDLTKLRNNWPSGNTVLERLTYFSVRAENGCLEWTGTTNKAGRPTIKIGLRTVLAARAAWVAKNGDIPEGKILRHVVCRNMKCIDADHFALGSHFDNAQDRTNDGMTAMGEDHYRATLTEEQVKEIILHRESHRAAARKYGVGVSTIVNIRLGHTWKHLPRPARGT